MTVQLSRLSAYLSFYCGSNYLDDDTVLSVYPLILLAMNRKIHVETRLILYYVQTLSTLIGHFIPKLTDDRDDTDSDITNVNLTCVAKCHVKSCLRTVYLLRTKQSF